MPKPRMMHVMAEMMRSSVRLPLARFTKANVRAKLSPVRLRMPMIMPAAATMRMSSTRICPVPEKLPKKADGVSRWLLYGKIYPMMTTAAAAQSAAS